MVTYKLAMAMTLIMIWLVANGMASSVVSEGRCQIQSFGVISTNLDTPDVSQNEKLYAATVYPVGFGIVKCSTTSSVEATEFLARARDNRNAYQLNCTLLL